MDKGTWDDWWELGIGYDDLRRIDYGRKIGDCIKDYAEVWV